VNLFFSIIIVQKKIYISQEYVLLFLIAYNK